MRVQRNPLNSKPCMTFEELYNKVIPNEEAILEQVDEYTLYCFYTGIEPLIPGKAYNAPYYRKDTYPSFSLYYSRLRGYEFMWKDHATGESGTIFTLIKKIENLKNKREIFARINEDFALGYDTKAPGLQDKIKWYEKPERNDIKIEIIDQPLTEKGRAYWNQFRIGQNLLDEYYTSQVKYFWTYVGQQVPVTALDPTFSYRIGEYHQLYSPFADKQHKFRNDLPENYFFGYLQLPEKGSVLIIDKSCKDVIFCRRLGFYAVCGKSETTPIPEDKVLELKERFTDIYLMLDNDKAGRDQVDKYMSKYPWLKPRFLSEAKDKTDLCIKVGFDTAEGIIRNAVQ